MARFNFSSISIAPCVLRRLPALIGLISSVSTTALLAQTQSPTLKEVVVSGSRSEQISDDLPASIDIINSRDLEEGQIQDIRDAAKNLPNVSVRRAPSRFGPVQSSTGRDANAGFNIRGLDGNRVLMLVDGIRAPRAYVFGASAFGRDYFDISLLKRIEIIRGPASVLYGSDGVAGLVNFITHEPLDFLGGGKTIGGKAAVSTSGDDDGIKLSGTVAGQFGASAQWLLSASTSRSNGLLNQGSNGAFNADRTLPNPEKNRSDGLLAKVVVAPTASQKHVITLEHIGKLATYDLLTSRARTPLTGSATAINNAVLGANATTTLERDRLTWDARVKWGSAIADEVQAVISYQNASSKEFAAEDRNVSQDRERDTTYGERATQVSLKADKMLKLSPQWSQKITYGVDFATAQITNLVTGVIPPAGESFPLKRFPDTRESSTALFAQSEFASEAWSITPGVRFDQFRLDAEQAGFTPPAASLSATATSPKLGVLYRATPQWSIFGNYASGFKAPNANQLNGFFENVTQFYKTVSNPSLKPETSKNIEIGLRGRQDRLSLDVAAFTGRFNDLIEDNRQVGGAGVPGNPTVFQSVNIGNATISGFEVKGDMDWGRVGSGRFSTPFAFGVTRGTDDTTGKPLNSVNPEKLNVALKYATSTFDLRLDVNHQAAKNASDIDSGALVGPPAVQFAAPSATTLDFSGQWRFSKKARLNFAIANLTNEKYWNWSDVAGVSAASAVLDAYTQPGRYLNLSLIADF